MPTQKLSRFSLHYEDLGKGPVVVLLHGFPLDGRVWLPVANLLSESLRVIVPDLRGFGRSEDDSPMSIESMADDVHELMRALGVATYAVGGLSMGGYAAQAFAKKYPSVLSALILCDTKAAADNEQQKKGRDEMIHLVRKEGTKAIADKMFPNMLAPSTPTDRPAAARELRQIMESIDPGTIERALVALRDREDFVAFLPTLTVPMLIVVGERDAISPPDIARAIHEKSPKATLSVIPEAGHMSPMEQPERVADAIREFLVGKCHDQLMLGRLLRLLATVNVLCS